MKRAITSTALAGALLVAGATSALAAHQHVDNPSGCHDTASQSGANSDGRSQWNSNGENQADENSEAVSTGTCADE